MGFGRRLARKAVRRATPRSVRRAMHPVRTAKRAVTPKAVRKVSRAVYTMTNPLGAAENKLIGAALGSGHKRRRSTTQRRTRSARTSHPASARSPAGTPMTSTDVRASEAMASTAQLANLMTVQRERFAPAQRRSCRRHCRSTRHPSNNWSGDVAKVRQASGNVLFVSSSDRRPPNTAAGRRQRNSIKPKHSNTPHRLRPTPGGSHSSVVTAKC